MTTEALSLTAPVKDSSIRDEGRKAKDNKALKVAVIVANVSMALFSTAAAIWMGYKHFSSTDSNETMNVGALLLGAFAGLNMDFSERTTVHSSSELVVLSAKDIAKTAVLTGLQAFCAKTLPFNLLFSVVNGIRATRLFSVL